MAAQNAFIDCYRREMPALVRFVMRHGADPHDAADAAQGAFAAAFLSWDSIRDPRAWLRLVAVREYFRRAMTVHRHEQPTALVPDVPTVLPADARLELDEQTQRVYRALGSLPIRQRQVMAWHYDGFSHAEIAGELDINEATVRQHLHKARRKLRNLLSLDQDGGQP